MSVYEIAIKSVDSRQNVFTNRKEKLLVRIIFRELRRRNVYLGEKGDFSLGAMKSYLEKNLVYFGDLGLSSDSLFSFLELGRITLGMYQELKNVHTRWIAAFDKGESRKQELRSQIFIKLRSKQNNILLASLQ